LVRSATNSTAASLAMQWKTFVYRHSKLELWTWRVANLW
jgi:hypothetical protein